MSGYRFGTFYRYYISTGIFAFNIFLQLSPGVIFSDVKLTEYLRIATESDNYTEKMKSAAVYIEPKMGAIYHITNWLNISISGGYEANFGGKLRNSDGEKSYLKAQWNGLRVYVGVGLTIPSNQ